MWCMAERRTRWPGTGKVRFAAYLDAIAVVLGDVRRATWARAYCTGLLLPGERKSVEPMAARIEPGRVQAKHQSMHHVVAKAEGDDAALLRVVCEQVLPAIEEHGMLCSMSRKGDCWDNAPMESFYATLKGELVDACDDLTRDEARADVFQYVEGFYNRRRLHSGIGYMIPEQKAELAVVA